MGGLFAKLGVVDTAGGEGTGLNKGVCAGVVGDLGLCQDLRHGVFHGHHLIVGGGEHGIHPAHQVGSGGDDLIGVGSGLFQVGNTLAVQVGLGLGNGSGGVDLGVGVQQANGLDLGVHSQHHVQNEGGVQGIGYAGDIGKPGQTGTLRIGDGGVDDGNIGILGGGDHVLCGHGGNGQDHIHTLVNHLGADLGQGAGVVLTVVVADGDAHMVFFCQGAKLGFHGGADLIQGGVIQLLDNGYGEVLFIAGGGGFRLGSAAAGEDRGGHQNGQQGSKQLFHNQNLLIK